MNKNEQLEMDLLAVGLTKPATQFGVPLVAFYFNLMACFLGVIFSQSFFSSFFIAMVLCVGLFVFLHMLMAFVTFKDAFGLQIAWLNITHFRQSIHFKLWNNTDSFCP